MYRTQVITKKFISGLLEGVTLTETVAIGRKPWVVGDRVTQPIGSSGYEIIAAGEPAEPDYHRASHTSDCGLHG